jgi:hypothetical protein
MSQFPIACPLQTVALDDTDSHHGKPSGNGGTMLEAKSSVEFDNILGKFLRWDDGLARNCGCFEGNVFGF